MNQYVYIFQQVFTNIYTNMEHISFFIEQVCVPYSSVEVIHSFNSFIDGIDNEQALDILALEWDISLYGMSKNIDEKKHIIKEFIR